MPQPQAEPPAGSGSWDQGYKLNGQQRTLGDCAGRGHGCADHIRPCTAPSVASSPLPGPASPAHPAPHNSQPEQLSPGDSAQGCSCCLHPMCPAQTSQPTTLLRHPTPELWNNTVDQPSSCPSRPGHSCSLLRGPGLHVCSLDGPCTPSPWKPQNLHSCLYLSQLLTGCPPLNTLSTALQARAGGAQPMLSADSYSSRH